MFCNNCGNKSNNNATKCSVCGQIMPTSTIKKPGFNKKIVVVIVIVAVIALALFLSKDYFINKKSETKTPDTNEPTQSNDAFLMSVEDVFSIVGRGTTVTGKVERGTVKVGDEIEIVGMGKDIKVTVKAIEMSRKFVTEATKGDSVGVILSDVATEDIKVGKVLSKPNSINAHTNFEASLYVNGRYETTRKEPIPNYHVANFVFRRMPIPGKLILSDGVESLPLGSTSNVTVELENNSAMEIGDTFEITEKGFTVARGTITKILK